ncbi:PAC2 family protein [Alloscardovia omnicolens]|uniref:PAC2 family protein n=1 Tax=Alloscardovia omnicolens TaxID=419015 RepID=UPI003A74EE0F
MTEFEEYFAQEGVSPRAHRTVMLSAFSGWNDADQAATQALNHLISVYSSQAREVEHICCGSFYDYTVMRPVIVNIDGKRKIMWPETTFTEINVNPDLTLLIQIAPEPNFKWTEYCQRSLRIAEEREVDEVITIGSMYADCTHTRPLPVIFRDWSDNTAHDDSYTGPIGVPTVLNVQAIDDGFASHGLHISVPSYAQYVDSQDNPMAILRILNVLSDYLGVQLKLGTLSVRSIKWKTQADMLAVDNADIQHYISAMEKRDDDQEKLNTLTAEAASDLINETEKFLRGFNTDNPSQQLPEQG